MPKTKKISVKALEKQGRTIPETICSLESLVEDYFSDVENYADEASDMARDLQTDLPHQYCSGICDAAEEIERNIDTVKTESQNGKGVIEDEILPELVTIQLAMIRELKGTLSELGTVHDHAPKTVSKITESVTNCLRILGSMSA